MSCPAIHVQFNAPISADQISPGWPPLVKCRVMMSTARLSLLLLLTGTAWAERVNSVATKGPIRHQ